MKISHLLLLALWALVAVTASVHAEDSEFITCGKNLPDSEFIACEDNNPAHYISYIKFPQIMMDGVTQGMPIVARLKITKVNGVLPKPKSVPAVVILEGTGGIDQRTELYSYHLNRAGIVTLEVDMWGSRNVYAGGVATRPSSPSVIIPDIYGALYFLAQNVSVVDPTRIGIMGFSWGAIGTMLSASMAYAQNYTFRYVAHNPIYPLCYKYNNYPGFTFETTTLTPIQIHLGDRDDYDGNLQIGGSIYPKTTCKNFIHSLPKIVQNTIKLIVYKNSTHAFDRLEPPPTPIVDPLACLGTGCLAPLVPNPKTTKKSIKDTIAFWTDQFDLE